MRTFANVTFYDDAFSSEEKSTIWTKTVDNSLLSTAYTENPYACEDTQEKVFALSYADATNPDYGFDRYYEYDAARRKKPTDYAKCMGVQVFTQDYHGYEGCASWWLRSPDDLNPNSAWDVNFDGYVFYADLALTSVGFVPAMCVTV